MYVDSARRRPQLVAAARRVLERSGARAASLRAIAAEAGVPLGTLQHVYPTKERLLRDVIEDVVTKIAEVLHSCADDQHGLEHAIRTALTSFWHQLVEPKWGLQLMQYELTIYSLRTSGQHELAGWQYEKYAEVIADWCEQATRNAGEECVVPYDQLARFIVAALDGMILQHVCMPDVDRSRRELELVIDAAVSLARR